MFQININEMLKNFSIDNRSNNIIFSFPTWPAHNPAEIHVHASDRHDKTKQANDSVG